MFSCEVCSQLRALAAVSDSMNVPSAPLAKRRMIATVSSTGCPRTAFEAMACTDAMSPHSIRRLWISWIRLMRIGPPPISRRQGASAKYGPA